MTLVSNTRTVDGVPMRWDENDGDGIPIVLLHGIPTSPALWRHVRPRLEGRRALAWEMVGYGASTPAGADHDLSVAAQADHLNALLDDLGIERAVLVGHDLGGGVAQIAAVRRPDRCAGLVLTNAIAYDSWPIPSVKAMRAATGAVARTPDPVFTALIRTLVERGHDDRDMARESFGVHIRPYLDHDGAAALARQVDALDVADTLAVADHLPDLDVPAGIIWGLADQFQKPIYGQRLARDLGTRPVGIRGGKHFTPEDHPEAVAAVIRRVAAEAS